MSEAQVLNSASDRMIRELRTGAVNPLGRAIRLAGFGPRAGLLASNNVEVRC